jgi:hypothetical protein
MDKSLMFFIAIGMGFLYFVTNFVGDIQAEDEKYQNNDYNKEHMYDQYKMVDSIGQDILDLTGAPENIQISAWNASSLKGEFLELFPDFEEMKLFISDRIVGQTLQNKLNQKLQEVEDKFFSGNMTVEQAERELSSLK